MPSAETLPTVVFVGSIVLGGAAILGMVLRGYLLNNFGKGTKGAVTKVVIHRDRAGGMTSPDAKLFGVEFEFFASDRLGTPTKHVGKQTTRYNFRSGDTVAVHYWSLWPRINRIVDRAM